MRKTISVTNPKVKSILEYSQNASELIEVAVLYYEGDLTKDYVDNYKQLQEIAKTLNKTRR